MFVVFVILTTITVCGLLDEIPCCLGFFGGGGGLY